jgi:hypothetical protein
MFSQGSRILAPIEVPVCIRWVLKSEISSGKFACVIIELPEETDPFEGLEDEDASDTESARAKLFDSAKLGFVRIRKEFVQRQLAPRPSVLAEFVRKKRELPLDLLLTIHALQPILPKSPLPASTWALLLGRETTVRSVHSGLRTLQEMNLLKVEGGKQFPEILLLSEAGDRAPMLRGKLPAEQVGRGFFTIPFSYWTDGLIDRLNLPGKAMLLVILRDTQDPKGKRTFVMAVERAKEFYGFSERTAERGYQSLRQAGILKEKMVLVEAPRHPLGRRQEWHRALEPPFSTDSRERLRLIARAQTGGNPTNGK